MSELAPLPDELEGSALEAALATRDPAAVAGLVALAPTLERKTELLWALDDQPRRAVLRRLPPALIGALIQNLEDDNRYLLGDLSIEQFTALLALCSPERQYYWVTTGLSFTDARANALPLLLPTAQLAEILLTRAEFETHLRQLAEYPLENQRLPPDMLANPAQALVDLFGAEGLLRQFPVADAGLAHFLQTVLDFDADRYVDLIRAAFRRIDYQEARPDEWLDLAEAPILLDHLEAPVAGEAAPAVEGEADPPEVAAIVPVAGSPLARVAAGLAPAQRRRVEAELQELFVRQAIAEGGSFLMSDLLRTARGVQAYLLLGLRAEAGSGSEAAVLAARPLHKIAQNGARVVEALRQVALRLQPVSRVLDASQQAVLTSIIRPRLTLSAAGEPRLLLLPGAGLPDDLSLPEAGDRARGIAAWVDTARALGLDRTEQALKGLIAGLGPGRAGRAAAVLAEELALGAVLFGKVSLGLTEPRDRERFAREYADEAGPTPAARKALRRAVEEWAAGRGLPPETALGVLEPALDGLTAQVEPGG
jgi:hypothetical protein